MANRDHRSLAIVEDDMADVAAALESADVLDAHIRGWCRKPFVSLEEIDAVSEALRLIVGGLQAARRALMEQRRMIE